MNNSGFWSGAKGTAHGCLDFLIDPFIGFGSICCSIGAGMMEFDVEEYQRTTESFELQQMCCLEYIDSVAQDILSVDPEDTLYQNYRSGTKLALDVGSIVVGGAGLAKAGYKGLTLGARKCCALARSTQPLAGLALREGVLVSRGAENVNAAVNLSRKLHQLENFQSTAARTRILPDGRIRYYDAERLSKTVGPTRGACHVVEWNPNTNNVRAWYECYDHYGNVNRVHPKNINGQNILSPHYPPTAKDLVQ